VIDKLRNIAIIAHVDHGKTTLVDCLLQQSGTLDRRSAGGADHGLERPGARARHHHPAKNTAITYQDYRINIVDTPGHADFGGEVERVLSMVDSVLLLVDAVDGPMPQTRFVTSKAFERACTRSSSSTRSTKPGARPDWVVDQVFDLFDALGASDEQLDFPIVYASAINGIAGLDHEHMAADMTPLFDTIVEQVPPPAVDPKGRCRCRSRRWTTRASSASSPSGASARARSSRTTQVACVERDGASRAGRSCCR
jgi:GTP-binding protein